MEEFQSVDLCLEDKETVFCKPLPLSCQETYMDASMTSSAIELDMKLTLSRGELCCCINVLGGNFPLHFSPTSLLVLPQCATNWGKLKICTSL